jgi:hypothetical protein
VTEIYDQPLDDIEALVKAAGQYVRASDDLRPRVLEAARMQCGEQRAQRCIRHLAVCTCLVAFFNIAIWQRWDDEPSRPNAMLTAAGFHEVFSPAAAVSIRNGDGDWRMIDAFTKLRRQQAQLLRLEI